MAKKTEKGARAPVVLVARQPGTSAVAVSGYKDGAQNIVTNALADGFSETASTFRPGEAMTKIESSSAVMGAEDLASFVSVGECAHCRSALLASADEGHMAALTEVASTLANGEIACPACEEMTKITLPTAPAATDETAAEADDGDDADEDEEEGEDESDDAEEDDSEDEDEDDAEEDDSEDDEDEDEDEDESEEDDSDDEDEEEDDAEEEKSSALSDEDIVREISGFVENANQDTKPAVAPAAPKTTTIEFDVSSGIAFETASVRVVPLKAGRVAVFAENTDGEPVNIGSMDAAMATEENASLFSTLDPAKLRVLQAGFCAALDANEDLSSFGFAPVVHKIPVAEVEAQSVASVEEAAVAEAAASIEAFKADYSHALAIAAAGMNKGIFESPMLAALSRELSSRRVVGADRIATQIIASAGDAHMKAVIARADDLMKKTPEVREEAAALIRGANTPAPKAEAPESTGSGLEIATAMLQIETPAPEVKQATKPVAGPVTKKRRFAY